LQKYLALVLRKSIFIVSQYIDIFPIIPPYEYVQRIFESKTHKYLNIERDKIKSWAIVGGYLGSEIPSILKSYPKCHVTVFECSDRYYNRLYARYKKNDRVSVVKKAVSDSSGEIVFHETNKRGSGSILKVGDLASKSYGMIQKESFRVETITLDEYFEESSVDVLQIDVQGAEAKVLGGGQKVLSKCLAVFCEISHKKNLYVGAVTFSELNKTLTKFGYILILLGTDFNLTGNALYIKNNP
jgi:2-O-methyltransferase